LSISISLEGANALISEIAFFITEKTFKALSLLTLDHKVDEADSNAARADAVPDTMRVPLKVIVSDNVPSIGVNPSCPNSTEMS
jgi:hypothetical protein